MCTYVPVRESASLNKQEMIPFSGTRAGRAIRWNVTIKQVEPDPESTVSVCASEISFLTQSGFNFTMKAVQIVIFSSLTLS